jgi:citrate synthase
VTRSALARHRATGEAWWETAISRVEPNVIEIRGYPIDELIGRLTYTEMLALLVIGRRLSPGEVQLLDAALVAGADHGPRAPSIAAARMAATCGVSFNSAVATGINMLGDHHGGAVEQFMALVAEVAVEAAESPQQLRAAATRAVADHRARRVPVAGYGHQLHDRDPRRARMLELIEQAGSHGTIGNRYLPIAVAIEESLTEIVGREVPLNVDGLSGIVYLELGFPSSVAKGLFSLARGAGIVAHALEEHERGSRIKGPCPPGDDLVRYVGQPTRSLVPPDTAETALESEFWSTFGEAGVCVFWGCGTESFEALDAAARRRLVAFTQTVARGPESERVATMDRLTGLGENDVLAAVCELAGIAAT